MTILKALPNILLSVSSAMPEGSIISLSKETLYSLIFQIINTIILTIVLVILLYKPVRKMLDQRAEKISSEFEKAELANKSAEDLKEEYSKKLVELEKEREKILGDAHKKALERSDHIIREAREEADYIYKTNMAELNENQQSMEDEMRRQLIDLSVLVAGKFVEDTIDEATQDKFISEALSSWEEGLWLD